MCVGYKACASYDTERFFRVPTTWDPEAGVITIKHTPEQVHVLGTLHSVLLLVLLLVLLS